MGKCNNIIFDLDGTLFKTDTVFLEALGKVCLDRGISISDEKYVTGLIGRPMAEICRLVFSADLADDEINCIRDEIRKSEKQLISYKGKLYEGVIELLDRLYSDGYTLSICSNGSRQYVDLVLNAFQIQDKFKCVKARIEGLSKSQLIKQIMDETKCCNPIIVGDTRYDIEAANDTLCLSIGVSYGYGVNDYEKADFVAHTPLEIYHIINKINNIYNEVMLQLLSNKSQVIHLDDFHNPSIIRNKDSDPILSYYNNAFNLSYLVNELIEPISSEGCIDKELDILDLDTDQYVVKKRYHVDKDTFILIEGVLLFRVPLDKYFDYRIFIDISFDEVINRAILRDFKTFGDSVKDRYYSKYISIQKHYLRQCTPQDKSDMVINNENYLHPIITKKGFRTSNGSVNIKLLPVSEEHINEIYELYTDITAQEMLGVVEFPDMAYYRDENNKCYAIIDMHNEFIGTVELFNISWKNRRAEFSIAIKPSYRGLGYGYKATRMILDIGFYELGLNRIWLRVLEYNHEAVKLYERIGFTIEGICRDESLRNGKFSNQLQMSILRREWIDQV